MKKPQETLTLADGTRVNASFPTIVSASRATDIPAFFADWFAERLASGYCAWTNPFNANQTLYVGFARTRAIVFWSKNPRPLIKHLPLVEDKGIGYYFQFTLNDYEAEKLEPGVPGLEHRLETFHRLAERIGPDRVVWRFDPLIVGPRLSVEDLLERVDRIADRLRGTTRKLVFSFADVSAYRKVRNNLGKLGAGYREPSADEVLQLAKGLGTLKTRHGLTLATCAEGSDLAGFGIEHNRCIDDDLLARLYPDDAALMSFLGRDQTDLFGTVEPTKKDPGQRKECGCIVSKDIGAYDTCPHLCTYCYANTSPQAVLAKFARREPTSATMIPSLHKDTGLAQPIAWHEPPGRTAENGKGVGID